MITIEIFHAAFEPHPVLVATLSLKNCSVSAALERAFAAIQDDWIERRFEFDFEVLPSEAVLRDGCRSTCVGDFARLVDERQQESCWQCARAGWKQIDSVDVPEQLRRSHNR